MYAAYIYDESVNFCHNCVIFLEILQFLYYNINVFVKMF